MSEQPEVEINRSLLAFLSGAMFFLAGMIELLTGLHSQGKQHFGMVSVGFLFLSCSLAWVAIGAKWKKEARQHDVSGRTRTQTMPLGRPNDN